MPAHTLPALALLFNALVWGLSWWPFRQLEGMGLHPLWSSLLVFVWITTALVLLDRGAMLRVLLAHRGLWGVLLAAGATNATFNWAITTGDVVRVILLFYLMPVWTALLAWPLLGERISRGAVLRMVLSLAGAALILMPEGQPGLPLPRSLADWLALIGGVCFAANTVLLRKHSEAPARSRILAISVGGILIPGLIALLGWSTGRLAGPPELAAGWVLAGGALALVILAGNLAFQYGVARVAAGTAAIIMLAEVPFAALSAAWLAGESLTLRLVLGGALILLSAFLATRKG